MYSADLSGAVLTGADLSGAQLQGVNFSYAAVDGVGSFIGAVADAGACWPRGFLERPIAKEITPTAVNDQGNIKISRGHEYPGCLKIP
jgi:Pentapeptide repeats (8 copies)